MFVAGVIPGIVMGALIGLANYIVCVRRNYDPEGKPFKLAITLRALRGAVWGLVAPVVIVGGIYFGIVTPTEAAGIADACAFIDAGRIVEQGPAAAVLADPASRLNRWLAG